MNSASVNSQPRGLAHWTKKMEMRGLIFRGSENVMLHGVYCFGQRTTQNAFTVLLAPNTPLFQAAISSTRFMVQVTQAHRWHVTAQAPVSGSGWARGTCESKQRKSLFWKFCGQGALPSNHPPYLPHTLLTLDLHLERCSSRSLLALLQLL